MPKWLMLLLLMMHITNGFYLSNTDLAVNYTDIPQTNFLNNQQSHPNVAFGCSVSDSHNNLYLFSSSYYYPAKWAGSESYRCRNTKKYVEIAKYNKTSEAFLDTLLIGENNNLYSNAVGDLGSDNVVSCGYHEKLNIIYYIASNYYKCSSNYKTDSSIVRINATTFSFIDRTILKNMNNVPSFSSNPFSELNYISAPTTSELMDDVLWLGFGTSYETGIWKINITGKNIELIGTYQSKYMAEMEMMGDEEKRYYERIMGEFKYSFQNEENKMLYFVSDTLWDDVRVLAINTTKPLNKNATKIYTLEGINYISNIKVNLINNRIYIISGSLSSELYQYDFNFNKLKLNDKCNIDFLKFPTEWGVITGMEIDYKSGYLYPIISNRYDHSGIAKIDMKDLSLDLGSHEKFKEVVHWKSDSNEYSYNTYYQKYNISHIDLEMGKILLVAANGAGNGKKLITIDLYGCAHGKGINGNICILCEAGKYSNVIGGVCKTCEMGYASQQHGSSICDKCERGKYGDGTNTFECKNCPAGQYSEISGADSCQLCTKGKFSIITPSDSLKNCGECEEGKISNIGAISCNFCDVGGWANNKKECIYCSKGKYSDTIGIVSDNTCKLCPIGFYNDVLGLTNVNQCKSCDNGKIGLINGAISNITCRDCKAGKFKSNIDECSQCTPGRISQKNSMTCQLCLKGQYSNTYQDKCIKCPLGKFNNYDGGASENDCTLCPQGRYSNTTNVIDIISCHKCPVGKYNAGTGSISKKSCVDCISGKFNDDDGNNMCKLCPPGHFSNYGYKECDICQKGQYSIGEGSLKYTKCGICPVGTFADFEGGDSQQSCKACPSGKWNDEQGSESRGDCKDCPPGYYGIEERSVDIDVCISCPAGKFTKYLGSNSENNCLDCQTGRFSTKGSHGCHECFPGKFSSNIATITCNNCDKGKYTNRYGSIICKSCKSNSESNIEKTQCDCMAGSYISNKSCIICPDEFECVKGVTIETMSLKKNYWRESSKTIKTYKCRNAISCAGGIIINGTDNQCSLGHNGPLCDICMKGWAKDDGLCLKCPENIGRTMSLTIVIPVICVIIIVFLIKTANPSNNKKEEVNGVVKIFMNYAQVFSLASSFQINWPTLIRYLFERAKEFSSPRVSFYSSDCAIGWGYYDKLVVYLVLPLVYVAIITILIGFLSCCFYKRQKKKLKNFANEAERAIYKTTHPNCIDFFIAWEKTAIVVGTFLSWPTIVEKTLEVMNCEKIGGNYYLIKDMSVECYTQTHLMFLSISYIALGLYGVGIPYMGFRLLYKYRYRLFDMQNRYDGSTPLSFLFLGYREERWYYEFIIMGKKAGLILISVFLRNHPRYQIIGASLLVQISFFLHVFLKPYDTITSYGIICNKLESISLLSLVMTLSTGLFFGTIDSGYQLGVFEDALIIILILSNGGVTLYFMIYFITLTWKTIKTHLRENFQKKFEEDQTPLCLKCCKSTIIEYIKEWSFLELTDNYGIHLQSDLEKHIFSNYFIEKQTKLNILNNKIDGIGKKKLSIKLDKIRCDIQVMEKQRCWQTIQNNRLYSTLKRVSMLNKPYLKEDEIEKLEEVFNLYIKHGIEYNKKMDELYMNELEGMIQEESNLEEYEMQNIVIVPEDNIATQIII